MSTQTEKTKDNLLVKLVKKSVGLPTGESNCCGTIAQNEDVDSCCSTIAQDEEVESCCGEQKS